MGEQEKSFETNADARPRVFGLDTPEQLTQWLLETGREYIIFSSADLVDALPWPAGVEAFQQIVHAYTQHRRTIEVSPAHQLELGLESSAESPLYKGETLTADELEDALRCLARDLRKFRPNWSPA